MPVDPKIISLELQTILGGVRLADAAIKKVQTQYPPGPPEEPTQVDALNQISTAALEIAQIANSILKDGGTSQ